MTKIRIFKEQEVPTTDKMIETLKKIERERNNMVENKTDDDLTDIEPSVEDVLKDFVPESKQSP